MNDLVSVITPCYNSSRFVRFSISSVINQTYQNWELIIVDDNSTDDSVEIINELCKNDGRIKLIKLPRNSGSASIPRNIALDEAKGRYIAFLDSDDLWHPTKLEEQLKLFCSEDVALVYSNYFKINENSVNEDRVVIAPQWVNYEKLFYGNVIACLTAIYDASKTGKVYFENVGHEDFVVWLKILKQGYIAKNTNSALAYYRVRSNSLSSNKLNTIVWIWNIYRNIEKRSLLMTQFYFIITMFRSLLKYLK